MTTVGKITIKNHLKEPRFPLFIKGADLTCTDTNFIHVWVDGGGNCGPASLGVVVVDNNEVIMTFGAFLGRHNLTNNIAELNAIYKGLRLVKHIKKPVKLYSDSKYALFSICKLYNGNKNRELINEVTEYVKTYPVQVEFIKVKGHSSLPYNEMADSIASWFLNENLGEGKQACKKKRKKS